MTIIRQLFTKAHAEGRAILSSEEFLLLASLAGLSAQDVRDAISDDILRRGVTGYWLREAADPGALLVFSRAMRETSEERDAA